MEQSNTKAKPVLSLQQCFQWLTQIDLLMDMQRTTILRLRRTCRLNNKVNSSPETYVKQHIDL